MTGSGLDSCNEQPCNKDDEQNGGRGVAERGRGSRRRWQINVEMDGIVHDVISLPDQRSDLVRSKPPKCLHHHQ